MIFKRLILYTLTVLFITSCYNYNEPEKPKNLISKDKMVNILLDLSLISNVKSKNKKAIGELGINQEAYIFSKYNIDSLQFALSNAYYAFHVKEYEDIYKKTKDSLEGLKKLYKGMQDKEAELKKKKKDSLNRVIKQRDSIRKRKKKVKDSLNLVKKEKDSIKKANK